MSQRKGSAGSPPLSSLPALKSQALWVLPSQTPLLFTCWQAARGRAGGGAGYRQGGDEGALL